MDMLKDETVLEALRLLKQGLSQRQIALRLNVSRGTVAAIAQGLRRTETPPLEQPPVAVYRRCPQCGVKVEMPCVACRARSYARRRQLNDLELAARPLRLVAAMACPTRRPRRPPPRRVA
jgi:transcriptional regulator with XRE-family HTH domain